LNKCIFILNFFIILLITSCATLKIGYDILRTELDGDRLIDNEIYVKNQLETILLTPEIYTMTAYTRQVFSPELKRTPTRYHSFYVITGHDKVFSTFSFTGTKKWMYSKGVWAINTESDINSYNSYINGINEWDVLEIQIERGINVEITVKNIIDMIDDDIIYFYNDHQNDKEGMANCNSTLQTTLVENI